MKAWYAAARAAPFCARVGWFAVAGVDVAGLLRARVYVHVVHLCACVYLYMCVRVYACACACACVCV